MINTKLSILRTVLKMESLKWICENMRIYAVSGTKKTRNLVKI